MNNETKRVLLLSTSRLYGSSYLDHAEVEMRSFLVQVKREGAMLRIENGETILRGSAGARIFRKGLEPIEISPGSQLDALLSHGLR